MGHSVDVIISHAVAVCEKAGLHLVLSYLNLCMGSSNHSGLIRC